MKSSAFTTNGTTYTSHELKIGKTVWTVMVASGEFNYVTVRKPSPWLTLGTEFKNFTEAISHYKNPTMKVKLLQLEMGLTLND